MTISHAELVAEAERRGMTGHPLEKVQAAMADAKRAGADRDMARLMLMFGRLRPEVREWLEREYPQ